MYSHSYTCTYAPPLNWLWDCSAVLSSKMTKLVESLQSHIILTMSLSLVQWTTRLLPITRDPGSKPLRGLMWSRDSPVSVVSLHWWPRHDWSFLWPRLRGLRPEPSLGPRADNVKIPLDLTQLFCPGFTLAAGPPSGFTTDGVGCWGGALWRTGNLTLFSPCLTGPVEYLFASHHKGPGFINPWGDLCETGILLLVLSRYKLNIIFFFYILHKGNTSASGINWNLQIKTQTWV